MMQKVDGVQGKMTVWASATLVTDQIRIRMMLTRALLRSLPKFDMAG